MKFEIEKTTENEIQCTLSGVIDENSNFEVQLSAKLKKMTIQCREVERINSVGILLWRRFFSKVRKQGTQLVFLEVAPSIMVQTGFIVDMILKDELVSLCLPFTCSSCKKSTKNVFTVDMLKNFVNNPSSTECPICKGESVFDDLIEEYTSILD
jgi:anti-anti-sigma regulatory factor